MDTVVIARWPGDSERRAEFALRRVPCLWLVDRGADAPIVQPWEGWMRLPATAREIETELRDLTDRTCRPQLVDRALLRNSFGSVALPESEGVIVERLLASHGAPVARDELERVIWPNGAPSPRALGDLVYRLRRHLKPLRLNVLSMRDRGFAMGVDLELSPAAIAPDDGSAE
jgi:hypothetical protein